MKILYIGNNLKGTNPTTLIQLSEMLEKEGFEVKVYSSIKNRYLRLLDICIGVLKHKNVTYLLIDTYSTVNFYGALLVSQLARMFSIKYIPILHGGNLPKRLSENPKLSELIFRNAYKIVSPSHYLEEEFKQNHYKTTFIPNSLNIKEYEFRKRVSSEAKIIWVRAFDKIYNPVMAVEVLAKVKRDVPSASLCMVGPDKDGSLNEVKQKAIELGVIDDIEFTGLLPKNEWIQKSKKIDIFINTTTVDNIPVSIIEAMALGLPIVSTNVGGLPYLINDGVDGVLVENNDVEEMTRSILKIINNEIKISEITNNAREKACKFDRNIVAEQWKKLLK